MTASLDPAANFVTLTVALTVRERWGERGRLDVLAIGPERRAPWGREVLVRTATGRLYVRALSDVEVEA